MSSLSLKPLTVLVWDHFNCEQELRFYKTCSFHIYPETILRTEANRDTLWAELERRMDLIPTADLIQAIDGKINLVII